METRTLFIQALNVWNAALEGNKDRQPYKLLIDGMKAFADDTRIGVGVYVDDPESPYDYYTVRFTDGLLELVGRGKQSPEIDWKVSRDFLQKVVNDPDTFIDQPERLDWEWLKSRLGLKTRPQPEAR